MKCAHCGERFDADTGERDGNAIHLDQDVIDIGLGPFMDAAAREGSDDQRVAPTRIEKDGGPFGSKGALCPICRAEISDIRTFAEARCDRCQHYFSQQDGYLHPLDPEQIGAGAGYIIPMMVLEQANRLPLMCCACGAPSTREIRVGLTMSLMAPHCARHSVGASISASDGSYGLKCVSYRFYCEFMRTNGVAYF